MAALENCQGSLSVLWLQHFVAKFAQKIYRGRSNLGVTFDHEYRPIAPEL